MKEGTTTTAANRGRKKTPMTPKDEQKDQLGGLFLESLNGRVPRLF